MRCVVSRVHFIRLLPVFSPKGGRQLAADVTYLRNLLAEGLGLDPDERLGELADLLTTPVGELSAAAAAARHLPNGMPAALATKRGAMGSA